MNDLEIARKTKLTEITKIAKKLGINKNNLECFGKYKAKITGISKNGEKKGKLILVTAINPTPLGEGKTTLAIAIADGLRKINKSSVLALREPSLGPVFGIKGGATGGGFSQVAPMDEINLHFTGDIHAITAANNLLSSMIDNHIYFGNDLKITKVVFKRCLDLNDRQLRLINTGISSDAKMVERNDSFDISVASEVMACFCLATSLADLRARLGNILIGFNEDEQAIYAKDLKAEGAMLALLKNAFKPNLVQTLEGTPAIIHGGPFANIAHGCNSIMATNLALTLGDYVITEAGFGADLGAEKFLNIKCRVGNLVPDAVVVVATIKALKYHGGLSIDEVKKENVAALSKGIKNLMHHIETLKNHFGIKVIVAINKYDNDTLSEIEYLSNVLKEKEIDFSLVEGYKYGGNGAVDIAKKLVNLTKQSSHTLNYSYELDDSIEEKILKVVKNVYGAKSVVYSDAAKADLQIIEKLGLTNLPICIAKTQYSLSDDPKNLECNDDYVINVRKLDIKSGAGFIVVIAGNIMTMPGLPKLPAAENIDVDDFGNIVGLF